MGKAHAVLLAPLERAGIDYMVTGGMAVAYYGRPRLTDDIDVIVRLDLSEPDMLATIYPPADYQITSTETLTHGGSDPWAGGVHLVHRATALKVHLYAAHDALHEWGFARRQQAPLGEASAWFVPVEYLIVRKLDQNRGMVSDRHLDDVLALVRACGATLDIGAVDRLADERSLGALWQIMQLNAANPRVRSLVDVGVERER